MIRGFMKKAKVGGGTNSTYLALIPKETKLETFARFGPISLCNASYKILAKILANKIKPLLNRLLSSNQGGFVEGRHILDNVIQRGLKQGCPLSPFLYILKADSLSRKLSAEKDSSSLLGLKPSNNSPAQNHALFVDDSLLLGGASVRIAKAFDVVLKCYCRVSGASINERKSEVYGWNIG
eukprot:PITA_33787